MDEKRLKAEAYAFAEHAAPFQGKPTSPPISYAERDGMLVVVLADGRKFVTLFHERKAKAESKEEGKVTDLPSHPAARKKPGRMN